MPNVCLPRDVVDKVKVNFKSGKLNPSELERMTSEERHATLSKVVGEGNAKWVNAEFEKKILLKNQQAGYIRWAQKLTNVSPAVRRDIISRVEKMDNVLNPTEEKAFLKDLAEQRLGFGVSVKEAKQIASMSKQVQDLEAKRSSDGTFPSEHDRMAYGRAKADLGGHLGQLRLAAERPGLKHMITNPGETAKDFAGHPIKVASRIAGTAKSVKAAFDDSALLRQGWKTLLTHPNIWRKNVQKNIQDLYRQGIKNQDIMREASADIISRPNARYYEKMGIAPKVEEEFGDPTLITKTPVLGRVYKTTESAFNAFMLRNRADLADYYINVAKKAGVDIEDAKQLKSIGKMIGGLTGRGDLGRFEGTAASATNNIFFSPRFVKSQIDTVVHPFNGAGGSNFVRKQAAINLVKIVGSTAAIFASANAIRPGSVELDPRSSSFGKIKVGDTSFDLTGGFSPVAVLAARIYTSEYKSGSKGTVSVLGSNPSVPSKTDVISQFITGKLSPAANRVWVNVVTKQEFNGAKPTLKSNAANLFEPLPVNTYMDAKNDPHGANPLATEISDALGLSANTSNPTQNVKPLGKTDQALKSKVGADKFKNYQQQYNDKLTTFLQSDFYKGLPNDDKQTAYMHAENKIKSNLYKEYDFKPPKGKSSKDFYNKVDAAIH